MSPDPLKTAQFYEQMFGARKESIRKWPDGLISLTITLNGSDILISQKKGKTRPSEDSLEDYYGLQHFGLKTDNIDNAVKELKAKGVKFKQEITLLRPISEEIAPIVVGVRIAFLWAPDNVIIELTQVNE